jgi:hypothetical protein
MTNMTTHRPADAIPQDARHALIDWESALDAAVTLIFAAQFDDPADVRYPGSSR